MSSSIATTSMEALLLLLIITNLPSLTMTQPNLPVTPTFVQCGPRILPLAVCAPFVQGRSTDPSQSCCDNLRHVNDQQPRCLCLLLNNSALSSAFPINTTLAMQLPLICSVQFDIVSCTASPMASAIPKSGFMGLGFYHNYAMKFKGSPRLKMLGIVICMSTSMLY
ncbi:non-specific lipid transfer protein GPI-anchored 1-like isoform X2 [Helianthus annuus]|uniref:non-specific lipid transfer protein GPI-anchored 1-like isoform X2 n=1 Tax=Helianthus annuus TaxID=4232 RepID=UPI000B905A1C|nr:non-specific lipid transfer protein GPI-anchored 1-like isoform X2 [Helianthus annuus]